MGNAAGREGSGAGLAYGLAAYGTWGLLPLFWKQLSHVPALELFFHRVVWALIFLIVLVALRGRLRELGAALKSRSARVTLVVSALLVGSNWFMFVYGVETERVLQVSLGYFINPLVTVVLGMLFLGERLRPTQWGAAALAASGVGYLAVSAGELPWISLLLAFTFGTYGLLRKTVRVDALPGTAIETLVLLVPSLIAILWLEAEGRGHFMSAGASTTGLLVLTGVVSAVPLWWFAAAARRLTMTSIGFLQYFAPSLHLLLAVFCFDEPFTTAHAVTFGCIWAGVALFAGDAWSVGRRSAGQLVAPRSG